MVTPPYVPDAGDLVWLSFDPQTGREQRGRRPALVMSPRAYNERSGFALACPGTSQVKGYPFEVALPVGGAITGAVLVEQIKCVNWRQRNPEFVSAADAAILDETRGKLRPLLGL